MNMNKEQYKKYASAHAKHSPILKNCVFAFLIGGVICLLGELLTMLYRSLTFIPSAHAPTLTSISLIFLSVLLTGLGLYDKIAKIAGAGTLVPITGFANAVASPAIDARSEGYILGVGAKIFTVSGPVILYGTLAGTIYGVIYWILSLF
ncbi:MAG: stage V sporulation protein AC [Ruminococcaceae bacterium]|nr:stage V sporulation protein AC [Oscillospiraceae bacterium]